MWKRSNSSCDRRAWIRRSLTYNYEERKQNPIDDYEESQKTRWASKQKIMHKNQLIITDAHASLTGDESIIITNEILSNNELALFYSILFGIIIANEY